MGKTLQVFSTTFRNWVHPHVRGADVHEPSGAILQRTTRYRDFPQFWGYGAQATSVEAERTALVSGPGLFHA